MPTLDPRGKIAAAQIGFFVPIAVITFAFLARYGLRRDAGWLFLFLFALVRITGGALLVSAELVVPRNMNLYKVAYVLQNAGLCLLMLSTIGFLGLVGQHSFSDNHRMVNMFRFLGFLVITALAISIAGDVLGTDSSQVHTGMILRRVAAVIFGVLWVFFVIVHIGCWSYRHYIRSHRRRLLTGITLALPPLGARVAYVIMSAWSSSDTYGTSFSSNSTLAKFNPITGDWVMYLVLSLIMEYIAALIYVLSGSLVSRKR